MVDLPRILSGLDALQVELQEAIDLLQPQIRGMQEILALSRISMVPLSDGLRKDIRNVINYRQRRLDLLIYTLQSVEAVKMQLSALIADRYPNLPKTVPIPIGEFNELRKLGENIDIAKQIFAIAQAVGFVFSYETPVSKT